MSINNRVIWHEGMLLQPQHLQQHDRHVDHLVNQKHAVLDGNLWGFKTLTLDLELLSVGKIGIKSASGVFPDGTYFCIPDTDKPPKPYVIPEGTADTILYLALPIRQQGVAEIGSEDYDQPCRYHIVNEQIRDAVAESNFDADVPLGSLACAILPEHHDLSSYTCLPITKVLETRTNAQVYLDETFITNWLDVKECHSINNFITEVRDLLNHRGEMLAGRLTDTQQAGTAEIVDFMLLQLVNKYEPYFQYLTERKPLHPEKLYTTLIQLLGELSTYTSNKRRPEGAPLYQHGDLFATFKPLVTHIRHALSMVLEQNATAISLESRGHGVWVGQIHDKELLSTCNFVLAVYADLPVENIRTSFPNQVKIAPVEQIRTLVSKALPGIPITPIAVAPRQIPYHANFSYFNVVTQHELWPYLEKSGGIALHIGSQIPGLKLELWAIKG